MGKKCVLRTLKKGKTQIFGLGKKGGKRTRLFNGKCRRWGFPALRGPGGHLEGDLREVTETTPKGKRSHRGSYGEIRVKTLKNKPSERVRSKDASTLGSITHYAC